MARMKQLPVRGRTLQLRGSAPAGKAVRARDRIDTWRRWYDLAAWKALRWDTLLAAHFTCAMCRQVGRADGSDLVGDHIKPHRGDREMFFDPNNVQCLCKRCHDTIKQAEEKRGLHG